MNGPEQLDPAEYLQAVQDEAEVRDFDSAVRSAAVIAGAALGCLLIVVFAAGFATGIWIGGGR